MHMIMLLWQGERDCIQMKNTNGRFILCILDNKLNFYLSTTQTSKCA